MIDALKYKKPFLHQLMKYVLFILFCWSIQCTTYMSIHELTARNFVHLLSGYVSLVGFIVLIIAFWRNNSNTNNITSSDAFQVLSIVCAGLFVGFLIRGLFVPPHNIQSYIYRIGEFLAVIAITIMSNNKLRGSLSVITTPKIYLLTGVKFIVMYPVLLMFSIAIPIIFR